jgi:predicted nuclease of predicted toxin-antitoxin system
MRFLRDEGVPYRLAAFLITVGHEAASVGRDYQYSITDRAILEIAHAEQRIVLTNDKDFGDLVVRDKLPHSGVILFRIGYAPLGERAALLKRVLDLLSNDLDQFIVVTHTAIRVRRTLDEPSDLPQFPEEFWVN